MKNVSAAFQVVKALPGRSLLLSLPVAVSIALAMATLAMDRGVDAKAQEAVASWGLDQIVVHGSGRQIAGVISGPPTLTEADLDSLRSQLRGVKHVLPTRRNNKTSLSFGGKSGVYKLYAVTPPWAEARHFGAERGQFLDDNDLDSGATVCLLGQTTLLDLFGTHDPKLGRLSVSKLTKDEKEMLYKRALGAEILVNNVPFTVKGILVEKGSSPAEGDRDARIIVPLTTFSNRLDKRLTFDQIVIQVRDVAPENIKQLKEQTEEILRRTHNLGDRPNDFEVRVPISVTGEARGISRSVLLLLMGLAGVVALVAVTVVGVVFHQAMRARRHEIGLPAIGAQPGDILWQIWTEGLLISLFGGIVGAGIGVSATLALGQWSDIPVLLDPLVLAIPCVIVLLTSLAGLFPARSAARFDPAQALRATAA